MFKKFAAEALGLSDSGTIIQPKDYDKVDADDYLFHEDQEKIHFLIKSKKDEYCFTNFGLTHVDGESAVSSKRTIKRYEFTSHRIARVTIRGERFHPRQPHHRHHIGVVPFEGDGECEDVEIANRRLGLDSDERLAPRHPQAQRGAE